MKKKRYVRQITSLEPFFESVPSVLVMTTALLTAIDNITIEEQKNLNAIYGGSKGSFYVTYLISIGTASLGITKYLLNGPYHVLSGEGFLNGLLTWRFFLAYLATMTSMMGKMLWIVFAIDITELPNGISVLMSLGLNILLPSLVIPSLIKISFSTLNQIDSLMKGSRNRAVALEIP